MANGPGHDILLQGMLDALNKQGLYEINKTVVPDPMMLPFSAQQLFQTNHVVIAMALITNDNLGAGSLTQTLVGALMQVGVQASAPVVAGVFCPASLLEAKCLIPDYTARWATNTIGYLTARFGIFLNKFQNNEFNTILVLFDG